VLGACRHPASQVLDFIVFGLCVGTPLRLPLAFSLKILKHPAFPCHKSLSNWFHERRLSKP